MAGKSEWPAELREFRPKHGGFIVDNVYDVEWLVLMQEKIQGKDRPIGFGESPTGKFGYMVDLYCKLHVFIVTPATRNLNLLNDAAHGGDQWMANRGNVLFLQLLQKPVATAEGPVYTTERPVWRPVPGGKPGEAAMVNCECEECCG
eukprot:gene2350-2792_t